MNKYFFPVAILLVLLAFCAAYAIFMLTPAAQDKYVSMRRDMIITFDKDAHAFAPETFTVSLGDTIYLELVNDDILPHGIAIDAYGITTFVGAGDRANLAPFTVTKAGNFTFYCPHLNDPHLSELGTLVVLPLRR